MLNHDLVLKSDELYMVGDMFTDGSGERATGLYLRDTRHLSHMAATLNGTPLRPLSARTLGPATAVVTLCNGLLRLDDGPVLPQTLAVEQRITLGTSLQVRISVHNFAGRPLTVRLTLELAADFRDLFDIRGFQRDRRGTLLPPDLRDSCLQLGYHGLDGRRCGTAVSFDQRCDTDSVMTRQADDHGETWGLLPAADRITPEPDSPPEYHLSFPCTIAPNGDWVLSLDIQPEPATSVPIAAAPTLADGGQPVRTRIVTDDPFFDRYLDRCGADLLMLQTSFADGTLPAAGIPWFVAPFGRDSLIVGLQMAHVHSRRAASTLRVLAALQGANVDPSRDEEPGKILHEVRYGEMSRTGEIPHTPYYGTVDATPLFVMLFAETVAWSGNDRLYRELKPNVERALAWIEEYGDIDGDGFVEYRTGTDAGARISHQGWKDSHDSLHDHDGRPVAGRIALVEVQGYVYAAYAWLADVAARYGDGDWAVALRRRASAMRERVEAAFWLETDQFYAQALDGDKQPIRAISSNPGHLLFCGLPSPERAAALARRFAAPDLNSGWGIRTLSSAMPTYNPMSYHNGSVWPHDNSLIGAGLRRYGHTSLTNDLLTALFHAARADPLARLPELYCGFARTGALTDAPVDYPVSCSPQAWAAAAGPLLVRSMLGLNISPDGNQVLIDPALPAWLHEITFHEMRALGAVFSLAVRRDGDSYAVESDGPVCYRRDETASRR